MSFRAKSTISAYVPDRGDLIHTDFSPSAGSEMALKHFAVVLTPRAYAEKTGRAIVCPVTSKIKDDPFAADLPALPPQLPMKGAILADQVRAIDLRVRGLQFVRKVSGEQLREIVDLLFALVDDNV